MNTTSRLALAAALGALAPVSSYAQQTTPRLELQLNAAEQLGASGGVFVPFVTGDGTVVFADGWLDYADSDDFSLSLGGGLRQQVGEWVLGGNAYFDFLHSDRGFTYGQLSAGLEALSDQWEFRVNGYAPTGDTSNEVDDLSTFGISGGDFVFNQGYEVALYGADAEVGMRLPVFEADSASSWRVYAGAFTQGSDYTETVSGLTLRSEMTFATDPQIIPGGTISLGGGMRYDSNQDLSAAAYIRFTAPIGGTPDAKEVTAPLFQRVERDRTIQTRSGALGDDELALGASGSSRVVQISAEDGSAADLNRRIAAAGEGAIVLASGEIELDNTITMMKDQILIGGGGVVDLTTAGGRQIRYQNPGDRTTLRGGVAGAGASTISLRAPLTPDVLVLADGNTVSTLSIIGGNNAIVANKVSDINLEAIDISSASGNAVTLADVSGATISALSINGATNAIVANGTRNLQIDKAAISRVSGTGIALNDVTGVSISTLSIDGGTNGITANDVRNLAIDTALVESISGSGVTLGAVQGATLSELSIEGGVNAIAATKTDDLTIDTAAISGISGKGVTLDSVSGAAISTLSIAGGTDAITVTNTDDLNIRNVGISGHSGNGIALEDVSGAAISTLSIAGGTNAISANNSDALIIDKAAVSGMSGNAITLGDVSGAAISTLSIQGGVNAISATNTNDLSIRDVAIEGHSANGIALTNIAGASISTLAVAGGIDAVTANGVRNLTIDTAQISGVSGNGIALNNVLGATITNTAIRNTFICESSTDCEYSIFAPDYVPNAAINAVGVSDLTIKGVDIADVTYGIFISPDMEEVDYENTITSPSTNIDISDVQITNSRREALLLVGASDIAIDNLHVDNSALDRDMDLVVFQTSHDISISNSTLQGGVNGLMFAYYFGIPGENPNDITVTNVDIADTSRAGVFMNPSWDVDFTDVTVTNAGTYGIFFYGDAWGYQGGPVRDINFDDFTVTDAAEGAFYLAGPIENIDGNIELAGATSTCAADLGAWSGTTITQDAGMAFTINGVTVDNAWLAAECEDKQPY